MLKTTIYKHFLVMPNNNIRKSKVSRKKIEKYRAKTFF